MNTFSTPMRAHDPGAAANSLTQRKQAQPAFQFKDNRPEAALQRKVQAMADHHPSEAFVAQRQALEGEEAEQTEVADPEMMEESEQAEMEASETATQLRSMDPAGASVTQLVHRLNFNRKQRKKVLKKNRRRNNGFYTCEEPRCGFQHRATTYATRRGRRLGDGSFHVDHIVAASHGGRPMMRNARVLCGTCNTSKGNRGGANRFGIHKYAGLHRKSTPKDYQNTRRNY